MPARDAAAGPFFVFAKTFGIAAAFTLVTGAGVTIFVDPLWVFRSEPAWLARTGGVNRFLDLDMRRAKPLQLFTRPAGTVLVGSSNVYRGLRPSDLRGGGAYNLGLSALMADELPGIADLIVARGAPQVLIGLDYYMFTTFSGPPRLERQLDRWTTRLGAWTSAAVSLRNLAGSLPGVIDRAFEPGLWRFDGFKDTPDYPAAVTRRVADDQNFGAMEYRPETLIHLDAALRRLRGRDVRIVLSPMSRPQRTLAAAASRGADVARWRDDVARTTTRFGIEPADLTEQHPFNDFDPAQGSSRFWLDSMHYKPEVGRWIFEKVGLAVAESTATTTR